MFTLNILLVQFNLLNRGIEKGELDLVPERDKLLTFLKEHGYFKTA